MRKMKRLIVIVFTIAFLLPNPAGADVISYREAWAFLYDFSLSWDGGILAPAGRYELTTGDAPVLLTGGWTLTIIDGKGRILAEHEFSPAAIATNGDIHLLVPYFDSGSAAVFSNGSGYAFTIDVRGSRVCNDNDTCEPYYGENRDTCPTDCGPVALANKQERAASIGQQIPIGRQLGLWVLRLALGAAGVILLVGVVRMLDSRRAP